MADGKIEPVAGARPLPRKIIMTAIGVLVLALLCGVLWFSSFKEYVALVLNPPNYEQVFSVRPSNGVAVTPAMLTKAKHIYTQRLSMMEKNGMIVSYRISEQPPDRLVVDLRQSDQIAMNRAKSGETPPRLALNVVHDDNDKLIQSGSTAPDGFQILPTFGNTNVIHYIVQKKPLLEDAIEDAEPVTDVNGGGFAVNVQFTDEAARHLNDKFAKAGKLRLAIVLDDKVITAPTIREALKANAAWIGGRLTARQATDLAGLLRAGGVPWPLYLESGRYLNK